MTRPLARPRLVLASSSPRRAHYLRELGFTFRRERPRVVEARLRSETPRRYVRRLAVEKALAVAGKHPGEWVLGADTTVVVDGAVLGKPGDEAEATRMLGKLSGRAHRVLTGIALARAEDDRLHSAVSTTRVVFRKLDTRDIRWYVRTGEPFDKAGGYGIQGKGGLLVERIEGSFSNVVGFPLEKFYELWRQTGLDLP